MAHESEYQFITTKGDEALSNKALDLIVIINTNHDEANTHVMLHLQHAVKDGLLKKELFPKCGHRHSNSL